MSAPRRLPLSGGQLAVGVEEKPVCTVRPPQRDGRVAVVTQAVQQRRIQRHRWVVDVLRRQRDGVMHLGRPAPALLAAVQIPMQHLRPQRPPRHAAIKLPRPFLRHLVTFSQKSKGFSGTLFGFHLLGGNEFRLRQDFAGAKCL